MANMFRTAVFKIFLLLFFFSNSILAQTDGEEYVFVAVNTNSDKRLVSDLHVEFNEFRDTLNVGVYFLENWKTIDSLEGKFILDRNATDTLYSCRGKTFGVYVYKSSFGDKLYISRPSKFVYFDNYGQQKSSWSFSFAAISFIGNRERFNTLFDCFYYK